MNIVIGFSRAKSSWMIGSEAIELAEKRPFSHVYIRLTDAMSGFEMVFQASNGMVNTVMFEAFKQTNIVVKEYSISCTGAQYTDVHTFLLNNLGIPYSYVQILMISIKKLLGIKLNIHNGTNAEICSELGARVCKILGISISEDLDFTTPSDLDKILIKNNIQRII
jgi:hypothetical protein